MQTMMMMKRQSNLVYVGNNPTIWTQNYGVYLGIHPWEKIPEKYSLKEGEREGERERKQKWKRREAKSWIERWLEVKQKESWNEG